MKRSRATIVLVILVLALALILGGCAGKETLIEISDAGGCPIFGAILVGAWMAYRWRG